MFLLTCLRGVEEILLKDQTEKLLIFFFIILFAGWCISFFSNYNYLYTIAIIGGVFLIALIFFKPDIAVALIFLMMYFQNSPVDEISFAIPVMTPIIIIIFCIIWSLKRNAEPIVKIRLKYFGFTKKFLFLLVTFFLLSTINAENPSKTFIRGLGMLLLPLFMLALSDYFNEKRKVSVFIRNLCLVVTFLALFGILQWIVVRKQKFLFLQDYIVPIGWQNIALKIGWQASDLKQFKASSVFFHQNIFGAVLASIAPIALVLFFVNKKRSLKIFYGFLFACIAFAQLIASSRGGLLNMMIGCGIVLLYVRPKHLWKMVFAGVSSVVAVIMIYLEKIIFLLRLKSGLSGRGQIWDYSLRMIERSPLFGVGFLNMGEEFYKQFGPAYIIDMMLFFDKLKYATKEIEFHNFHAHNLFLNLSVEMGVFAGLTALIFYIVLIYKMFLFISKEKLKKDEKLISVALLGVFVGSFVHSFVDTNTLHYIFFHVVLIVAIEKHYIMRLIDKNYG
ncbi:MAG: O-antigen ligase family protein [Candidatus Aureabacteria bacterium]|nr:O-antigen ligase family protein [Candidatus Auribacterota bacterium]